MTDTLTALFATIEARKQASDTDSYVAALHHKGLHKILEKVGEEAVETVLAAKDVAYGGDTQSLINETADLWFHTLVMLSHLDLDYRAVTDELARRFDVSGLEEKRLRASKKAD